MPTKLISASIAVLTLSLQAYGTVLTFDITGISNFLDIDPNYGNRVNATTEGAFSYGVAAEGFTPNVTVEYQRGSATGNGIDPALWISGYGDLVNVLFEDADNNGVLTLTLQADPGFNVQLYGFDLAAYSSDFQSAPSIALLEITNEASVQLHSTTNLSVSITDHTSIDFSSAPLSGSSLTIRVDARNLGSQNDNIAIDNIRFGQTAIPEPSLSIFGLAGLITLLSRRARS